MVEKLLTKRVSLIELFYDLVFVYMISRATSLIHHLHNGVLPITAIVIFVLVVVVFINSWMIQMVFTNRYGKMSWTNVFFTFVDMVIILYMSNAFTATFDRRLATFFTAAGLLSLTLCLQYLITFFQSDRVTDKKISLAFTAILGFRTITLLIGGYFYNSAGITIALVGVFIGWIAPGFTGRYTQHHPIIFSHLLERLTALVIVMFGETIVGIADYFTQDAFSVQSILIFVIVAGLFFTYITEFDHLINEHQVHETGNRMIYLHYFVLFGLSLITVALKFINEPKASPSFAVSCLYWGIISFYVGLALANCYNQTNLVVDHRIVISFMITTSGGFALCLAGAGFSTIVAVTAVVIIINAGILVNFLIRQTA